MRQQANYYERERRKGRNVSLILHLLFLIVAIFGLPDFMSPAPPEEPSVITVEILPITGITNVKPSDSQPAEETKPDEKRAEQKKEAPPVKTADSTPPPPPPEPAPVDKAKEKAEALKKAEAEKKKEEEKKKKEKQKDNDLAAVLKAVKDTAQKEKKDKKPDDKKEDTSPSKSISNQYNPSMPMSLSERDAIMSQIGHCWHMEAGAKDAQNLVVVVNAEFNVDGSYVRVELANESRSRYNTDTFFRAAADSAVRAVKECSPLKDLPPAKYDTWHFMELRFDPKYMLN